MPPRPTPEANIWTTRSFRVALIILVASMHPVGREWLNALGFKIPRDAGIVADEVNKTLAELAGRQMSLEKKLDDMTSKVVDVDRRFYQFEVDFERYKNKMK